MQADFGSQDKKSTNGDIEPIHDAESTVLEPLLPRSSTATVSFPVFTTAGVNSKHVFPRTHLGCASLDSGAAETQDDSTCQDEVKIITVGP
jgi:hypothetical protein